MYLYRIEKKDSKVETIDLKDDNANTTPSSSVLGSGVNDFLSLALVGPLNPQQQQLLISTFKTDSRILNLSSLLTPQKV
jgi:hypothetical protein